MRNKEIDIAHALIKSPLNGNEFIYTSPYLNLPISFWGLVGTRHIENIQDLVGKKIGIIEGSGITEEFKEKHSGLTFIEFNLNVNALTAIQDGLIDLFIGIVPSVKHALSSNYFKNIESVGDASYIEFLNSANIHLGVHKDHTVLQSILQKGVNRISIAEYRALTNKWKINNEALNKINLNQQEIDWLSKNKTIMVASDPTAGPIELVDENGDISGIAGDYLKIIGERLKIKFEWAGNENWADGVDLFDEGKVDMFSVVVPNEERRKILNFTAPIHSITNVIFARIENGALKNDIIGNLSGLNGKKIAQVSKSSISEIIRKDFPEIEIIEVPTITDALRMVSTGKSDAYIGGITAAAFHIAEEGFSQIHVVGETPYIADVSMGVSTNQPILSSIMQKAIASFSAEEKAEIARNWLSLKIENEVDYTIISTVFLISLIIIGSILKWNQMLRREVCQRLLVEKELTKAKKIAVSANEAKSSFLATMSHEIRTPINGVLGSLNLIDQTNLSDDAKLFINQAQTSGELLKNLLNDLLDLGKLEAGKMKIEHQVFDIRKLATQVADMWRPAASTKNVIIEVNVSEDVPVYAKAGWKKAAPAKIGMERMAASLE
jgi:ABC-type amino acid transport substrate-binding protein